MDFGKLLDTTITGLGYELVEWERSGRGAWLRIFVDKPGGVSIDDCAQVSHHLSRLLAVEGVNYDRLEVSSPGLTRELKTDREWRWAQGKVVRCWVSGAVGGRTEFVGRLAGVDEAVLTLEGADGAPQELPRRSVTKARLEPDL